MVNLVSGIFQLGQFQPYKVNNTGKSETIDSLLGHLIVGVDHNLELLQDSDSGNQTYDSIFERQQLLILDIGENGVSEGWDGVEERGKAEEHVVGDLLPETVSPGGPKEIK